MGKDNANFDTFPNGQTDGLPNIPKGSSLQNPPTPEPTKGESFPESVFNDLPPVLRDACNVFTEQIEREIFLLGALAVISGILPNVRAIYDGAYTRPNIFVYIIGAFGSGKGSLKWVYRIAKAIHDQKKELSKDLQRQYKTKCAAAKENGEDEPENPGNKMLYIPANNSKSGIVENLADNDGAGVIFETEGDTLADALKTDYGGFSDILRKAFHQESISFFRRANREHREIDTPRLSILLSSTPDQYQKLVPQIHNGLFSRILHYRLCASREFKNVFDPAKNNYTQHFDDLGKTFLGYFNTLEGLVEPIEFDLRESQKAHFLKVFSEWKKELGECVSTDLDGTVNRLGLICFRLAMILTTVRSLGHGDTSEKQLCDDADFYNALKIVDILKDHAVAVFYDLPQSPISKDATKYEELLSTKAAKIARAKVLRKQGKTWDEVAADTKESKTNLYRWLSAK